jgi:hypothetical protein
MRREAIPLCDALHLALPSPLARLLALQRPPGGTERASRLAGRGVGRCHAVAWVVPPEARRVASSSVPDICLVSTIHLQRLHILTMVCLRGSQERMEDREHRDPHMAGARGHTLLAGLPGC